MSGAQGCIGAWVVKTLIDRGDEVVVFDLSEDARRMRLIMGADAVGRVRFVAGDITDGAAVRQAIEESAAGRVIHLAGLQVPMCKADPARGALVNVIGTLNVFEAARTCAVDRVVYASSAAVYGDERAAVDEAVHPDPWTHYGVFKQANEGNARVYFHDHGISSVGLRPLTVYGVGRDQGLTSDPTRALKAAVVGRPFTIRFCGSTDFVYVADVADAFIACADRSPEGAFVYNVHGETETVERFVELARGHLEHGVADLIRVQGDPIPIAPEMDDTALRESVAPLHHTSLDDGIAETIARFSALRDEERLDTADLES